MGSQQQPWVFAEDRFGRRLKHEREQRGMTQADVARVLELEYDLKVHPTAIAKMEQRGVERPRAIRLFEARAIADLFGLTVDEMMSTANAELEALSREFTQLGSQAEALRSRTDELFVRLRSMGSIMAVPPDQVSPELQEYRNRIIRALAALHETDEARRLKAEALLDEAVASGRSLAREDQDAVYAATAAADSARRAPNHGDGPDPADVGLFDEENSPSPNYRSRQEAFRALGREFYNARNRSGASVLDVNRAGKIPPYITQSIEDGNFDRIGIDAKVRGYLRSYAEIVGLAPGEILRAYRSALAMPEGE